MFRWVSLCLTFALLTTSCGKPDRHPDSSRRANAFDPAAFGPREAPDGAEMPPLSVVDYGPRGEEIGTRSVGQIRVRFNRAVRPVTGAADQRAEGLLTLESTSGPVEGEAYFKTPNLLVFETEDTLSPAQRYTAHLSADLDALDGSSLNEELTWQFATNRPGAHLLEPASGANQVDTEAPIFLQFTMDTDVEEVRPHIRLSAGDRELPVTVRAATDEEKEGFWRSATGRIVRIDPEAPLPVDTEIVLTLTPGWTSNAGPLPAKERFVASFETHPTLRVEEVTCGDSSACPMQPLQLRFSTYVPDDQVQRIDMRPRPARFRVGTTYGMDGDGTTDSDTYWIDGQFLPGVEYEVIVDRRLTDMHEQPLGETFRSTISFAMPPPELNLTRQRGTIEDDGEAHVGISSRHVERIRIRAARVPVERYVELRREGRLNRGYYPAPDEFGDVVEKVVDVDLVAPTEWGSTPLRLETLIGDWRGPVAVEVLPEAMTKSHETTLPSGDRGIFQFTSLAPHLVSSIPRALVRVEDLQTREPMPDVRVTMHGRGEVGTTDEDGLLWLDAREYDARPRRRFLSAHSPEGERAVIDLQPQGYSRTWARPGEFVKGEVLAERGAYQPGEDVHVVGWAALRTPHDPHGFTSLPPGTRATVELLDSRQTTLDEVTVQVDDGKFWGRLSIPESARLGRARVRVEFADPGGNAAPRNLTGSLRIEEYRVPNFEVNAHLDEDEFAGDARTHLNIEARYFSGGPIEFEDLRIRQTCWQTAAPAAKGWSVGVPDRSYGRTVRDIAPDADVQSVGHARVPVQLAGASSGHTRRCRFTATVQSPAFQEEGDSATAVIHPGEVYLGIRDDAGRLVAGDDHTVALAAFDHDGRRATLDGRVEVTVSRTVTEPVWTQRGGRRWVSRYDEETTRWKTCAARLRSQQPGTCRLRDLEAGAYRIDAQLDGKPEIRARAHFHVGASDRAARQESAFLELTSPDGELSPGDPATLTVRAAEDVPGVLVVERFGIREAIPFHVRNGRASITVTPDPSWAPEMHFRAFAIDASGTVPELVKAESELRVDASPRRLDVEVHAPATATIRQSVPVEVRVRDHRDAPVDGRVAIWAVDEAVLGLTRYEIPDLLRTFLAQNITGDIILRAGLSAFLPPFTPLEWDPYRAGFSGSGYGGGGGFGMAGKGRGGGGSKSAPRANFETTPFFLGDAEVTDGAAEVTVDLPDNLTAYRIIAVASTTLHDNSTPMRFGDGASRLRVTAPLIARPALPRFTRPGDAPELAVVVDNQSEKSGTLAVEMSLNGDSIEWTEDGNTRRRTLEITDAKRQHRIAFSARAIEPGETPVTISAVLTPDDGSAPHEDVVRVPLRTDAEPTIVETVATYGTVSDDTTVGIPVKLPDDVRPDYGGVAVTVTSTLLGGLRDATRELVHYPYGCVEQTSSRMLPLVALSDLTHFVEAVEIPNGKTIDSFVEAGIGRILSMQTPDGGFSYWPGGVRSNPYASAYATWVLQLARDAGHDVPGTRLERALDYLATVTTEPDLDWPDSVVYYHDIRRAIAVHVLTRAGRAPGEAIDGLYERREHLPAFSRAFIALALHDVAPEDPRVANLTRELTNTITEHPGTAAVVETPRYDLGPYFHSDLRSSAIVMMALLELQPDHPLNPKLARGLMEKRYRGAWRNTQENAYALVAMAEYARAYERVEPNFGARVWTDHAVMVDDRWMGRSSRARTGRLPMREARSLAARDPSGTLPVNIRRKGQGRAYYRLAMTYSPVAAEVEAIARGIDVRRTFRHGQGAPSDEIPARVAAGELIAIDIELNTKSLSRYVAVDIPLPAGLEGINLALGGPKVLPMGGTSGWWVSHAEYHDDRVVLFADTLHPGSRRHTVYVRATTPGSFVFPPATAKAMYTPEVFGRTDGGTIEVGN